MSSQENTRPINYDYASASEITEFLKAPKVEIKEKNKVYEWTALCIMLGIIIANLVDK